MLNPIPMRTVLALACLMGVQITPPPLSDWVGSDPEKAFQRHEVFLQTEGAQIQRLDRMVLGVRGNGTDTAFWRHTRWRLEPRQTYALLFNLKATGSGVCAIAGANTVNRDFSPSSGWRAEQFVFRAPDNPRDSFIRVGQWNWNGEVLFDSVRLIQVQVVHSRYGTLVLGEGEQIRAGRYQFFSRFYENANLHACLESFDAVFNTNRWVLSPNASVTYRHSAGSQLMTGATLTLHVPFEQSGALTVMARSDKSPWRPLTSLSGAGAHKLELPAELFPTGTLWIRLTGTRGTIQVDQYHLDAPLQGESRIARVGRSLVLFPETSRRDTEITDLALEVATDGNWLLTGTVKSTAPQAIEARAFVRQGNSSPQTQAPFTLKPQQAVRFRIVLPVPAARPETCTIGLQNERGRPLWSVQLTLPTGLLRWAHYGYRLTGAPDALGVWWCEWGWKVGRERPLPNAQDRAVRLSLARGEYEPVQIVLRPRQPTTLLKVELSDLRNGRNRIPARHLSLREVAYVFVQHPTDSLGEIGEYPDPLPPLETPLRLEAERNQPLWLTVYAPYGTPAGIYRGTCTLHTDRGIARIPLEVEVYGFDLPRTPTVRSGFGVSPHRIEQYHRLTTDEQKRAVWDKYMQTFREHRLAPYSFYAYAPYEVRFEGEGDSKRVVVDFSRFDAAAQRYLDEFGFNAFVLPVYGLPGGRHPNYTPGEFGGYKEGTPEYERLWSDYMRQLEAHLREKGWLKKAYLYWFDEPETADYPFVRRVMEKIKQVAPGLTRMLTEQPEPPLIGSVDLWCPLTALVPPQAIAERRKAGEEVWWYVCTGPKAPYVTLFIDHPGVEMRLWLWQTWQYGVQGILIWETTWWHNEFAYPDSLQNPWEDPMSYVWDASFKPGTRLFWGNGDGRLLYPPRRDPNRARDPVIADPIPSFRWECLRDGVEDYEYFALLQRLCEKAEQNPTVPRSAIQNARALLQVPPEISKSMTEFTYDPRPMLQHRARLARAIEQLQRLMHRGTP